MQCCQDGTRCRKSTNVYVVTCTYACVYHLPVVYSQEKKPCTPGAEVNHRATSFVCGSDITTYCVATMLKAAHMWADANKLIISTLQLILSDSVERLVHGSHQSQTLVPPGSCFLARAGIHAEHPFSKFPSSFPVWWWGRSTDPRQECKEVVCAEKKYAQHRGKTCEPHSRSRTMHSSWAPSSKNRTHFVLWASQGAPRKAMPHWGSSVQKI